MNKLTIAKIYLGLLALGLVILGFLIPEVGLPMLFVLSSIAFVGSVVWAIFVVLGIWDN